MEFSPIRVTTINDEVYDRLHMWIMNGTLSSGAKISTRSIADSLEVSTMPVREAFRRLESDGLVVFERRSVRVAILSDHEVLQVFQIRLRLEQLAAEWALEGVQDDDVVELEQILDQMDSSDLTFDEWRPLNHRFHRRFYECAGSPHLLEALQSVLDKVEPYMAIYVDSVEDFREAAKQHREILALIRSRDQDALLAEIAHHLDSTAVTVLDALARSRR